MKDRYMNGFIAGMIGNIPTIILDVIASIFDLDKYDFTHFVSILIFDKIKLSSPEYAFSLFLEFLFAGVLGVLFTYYIFLVKENYYFIKAAIFGGLIIWFSLYSIDIFFSIQEKTNPDFSTVVVHFLISIIWGLATSWIFAWLEKRETIQT